MIKQECIGIPDMILLLMIFLFQKIKIKAEIVLSPGGAYFSKMKFNVDVIYIKARRAFQTLHEVISKRRMSIESKVPQGAKNLRTCDFIGDKSQLYLSIRI